MDTTPLSPPGFDESELAALMSRMESADPADAPHPAAMVAERLAALLDDAVEESDPEQAAFDANEG